MLLLIPTPIGNLQDLSPRALQAFRDCDVLFSEDTRMTKKLLFHYQIEHKLCIAYHKHNEKTALTTAIRFLQEGKKVGLVSDAGMPCIFDPGTLLVQAAWKEGFQVSALPGPSAPLTALSMSGLLFSRFQCIGFLPREKESFETTLLHTIAPYEGVTVALESPERIVRSTEQVARLFPTWEIVLVKEISKLHEMVVRGTAQAVLEQLNSLCCKGEWVFLFSEKEKERLLEKALAHVQTLMNDYDFSMKSAVQATSYLLNVSKNELYNLALKTGN